MYDEIETFPLVRIYNDVIMWMFIGKREVVGKNIGNLFSNFNFIRA